MSGVRLAAPMALSLLLGLGMVIAQTVEERGRVDESTAAQAADELYAVVREAIAAAGGDLERQTVHLAVGFSTGHFGTDPLQAEGTRLTARFLADRLLVPGDRVSIFAWELGIWEHTPQNTWGISVEDLSTSVVQQITDALPLSAAKNSSGGHDTELTIVQALDRLSSENNVVLVLLTNSVASVKGHGDQVLIGQNDPRFQDWLSRVYRAPAVNRAGASSVLTYRVELPDGRNVNRTAEAIVLVSNPFKGSQLANPRPDRVVRSDEPPEPKPPPNQPPDSQASPNAHAGQGSSWVPWVIGIAGIAGIGAVVWWWRYRTQQTLGLKVDDRYVEVEGKGQNQAVLKIAGEGAGIHDAHILYGMPPEEFFQIKYLGPRGYSIQKQGSVKTWRVNGEPVHGNDFCIKSEDKYEVDFEVEVEEAGVPRKKTHKLTIEATAKRR